MIRLWHLAPSGVFPDFNPSNRAMGMGGYQRRMPVIAPAGRGDAQDPRQQQSVRSNAASQASMGRGGTAPEASSATATATPTLDTLSRAGGRPVSAGGRSVSAGGRPMAAAPRGVQPSFGGVTGGFRGLPTHPVMGAPQAGVGAKNAFAGAPQQAGPTGPVEVSGTTRVDPADRNTRSTSAAAPRRALVTVSNPQGEAQGHVPAASQAAPASGLDQEKAAEEHLTQQEEADKLEQFRRQSEWLAMNERAGDGA